MSNCAHKKKTYRSIPNASNDKKTSPKMDNEIKLKTDWMIPSLMMTLHPRA